jgi:O-antigen/teichoic acid export membrane protein
LNKLLKNSIFGSGSFVVVSIVALITTPYFVIKLTAEVYGVYILLTSLVGYYGLADLGLGQGVIKFVSENVARGDRKQAVRYINAAVLVQFTIGILVTALFSFFAEGLVKLLRIPALWTTIAILGIRLCSFGFLFSLLSSTLAAALQGLQRFDITSTIEACMNILLNIVIVCLLLFGYGLREIIFATTVSSIVIFIIYIFALRINFPDWGFSFQLPQKELKELFYFSFFLFISRASNLFANFIVRYIVAVFAGPAAVTIFVVPAKLLGAIGGVLSSGANAVFPYASEVHTVEPAKIKKIFRGGSRIFAAISIPVLITIVLYSRQLLTVWMGQSFADQSWLILSILAFSGVIASQTTIPNLVITGMGHSKTLGFFGLLALISYSIFVPVFINAYGVVGAAVGMLCATIANIGFVYYLTTKIVKINIWGFLASTFKNHLIPILIIVSVYFICSWRFEQNTFFMLSIGTFMLAGYYAFLFLKEDELIRFAGEFRQRFS